MISAEDLIKWFNLIKHPEGGYFRESYRAQEIIPQQALPSRYRGSRAYSTAIYFLLPSGAVSRLHRLHSDEIWHFYLGYPLELLQISPEGCIEKIFLGQDIKSGEKLQHTVPAGCWFGARPYGDAGFSFVGCTVAPGFEFADFELADTAELAKTFPGLTEIILPFC
jgi:predicted cupin superfamily sugar epimerase